MANPLQNQALLQILQTLSDSEFSTDSDEEPDDEPDFLDFADETDDLPIECIIAEYKRVTHWYLVKWKGAPVVQSSWETQNRLKDVPWIIDEWEKEKARAAEGKTTLIDAEVFKKLQENLEEKLRQKNRVRRFRNQVKKTLTALSKD